MALPERVSNDDDSTPRHLKSVPPQVRPEKPVIPGTYEAFDLTFRTYKDAPDTIRRPKFMRLLIDLNNAGVSTRQRFLAMHPDFKV